MTLVYKITRGQINTLHFDSVDWLHFGDPWSVKNVGARETSTALITSPLLSLCTVTMHA